ncbi:MAG TPA: ISAzo13 family transposase [Chloroflexota bacterium]
MTCSGQPHPAAIGPQPSAIRVLIAGDQPLVAAALGRALERGPYLTRACRDSAEAVALLADWQPHLVVVDLDGDTDRLLARLRSASRLLDRVPVIALSRRTDPEARVAAFERGVDDVVSVPFSPEELVARARAVVRRAYHRTAAFPATIRLGELEIDLLRRRARIGRHELHLTSLEQSLLYLLAANAGRLVTRDEILDRLWGADYAAASNAIDRHVRNLRAKLHDDWQRPRYIATVPGLGYRFQHPSPGAAAPADAPPTFRNDLAASARWQLDGACQPADADLRLAEKLRAVLPYLNERQQRLVLAAEARALGHGGITRIARASGVSRPTVQRGLRELAGPVTAPERVRQPGGGRKKQSERDPALLAELEALVDPDVRGDPASPLRWTCQSTRQLASALSRRGHRVSYPVVAQLLHAAGYRLPARATTLAGRQHSDRNGQFRYLNEQVKQFLAAGQPVVSVHANKKELAGAIEDGQTKRRRPGQPEAAVGRRPGNASPDRIHDKGPGAWWVSARRDHDTVRFAVASMYRWWRAAGAAIYRGAERLLICPGGWGGDDHGVPAWQAALQRFADETGLAVTVCHLPPGTCRWTRAEHQLLAQTSVSWCGRSLISHEVVVELIVAASPSADRRVQAESGRAGNPARAADERATRLRLTSHEFHGEWNYTLTPARPAELRTLFPNGARVAGSAQARR